MRIWLARQRYLVDYALAAMARQRAKNLGLLLVHGLLVFALASVMLLASALRQDAAQWLTDAPDVVAQGLQMGRHSLSHADDVAKLRQLRGVQQVEGRLWGYLYDTSTGANYTLQVPSATQAAQWLPAQGEALLGEGVARLRGVVAGQRVFLVAPSGEFLNLQVKSVLPASTAAVSADLVLLSEADFRRFFGLDPQLYTDIALRVRNPQEVAKVAEKVGLALRQHRIVTRADLQRTYEALFSWREGLLLAMLAAAVLAFGILAFDKASGLSAQERREIGILKAVGWDTSDIIHMKLWEASLIAGTAFGAGCLAAYVHVFALGAPLLSPVLKGWSVLFPRAMPPVAFDGLQLATLALLAVLPYLVAIVVPIWRTASADPDAVMR
jgi:lipoprotein-releasing system permease protein